MDLGRGVLLPGADRQIWDNDSGQFINEKFQRIAEVINEWDPTLFLLWIPPANRTEADTRPYAIEHRPENAPAYIVMTLTEEELDHRVIAKLWTANQVGDDVNAYLKAENDAAEALRLKAELDEREEMHDRAQHLWKSEKSTYQLGKGRVVHL